MVLVRTRWTGGGSRSGACLTEVIVYSLLFVVVSPRLASYSCLPRAPRRATSSSTSSTLRRAPRVREGREIDDAIVLKTTAATRSNGKMIAVPAISCAHAMWRCFLWVAFGPKYQPEPSEQALARLYTSDVCVFGGTPNQCLFLLPHIDQPSLRLCSRHGEQFTGHSP